MKEARPGGRTAPWAALVGVLALLVLGARLGQEPHFVDESAYIAQAYYADLYAQGQWHDPAWLKYPAYDLPPLPKYLIGLALHAGGYTRPGPTEAFAWYRDTSTRPETAPMLRAARWPSVVLGAVGCVAIFALGTMMKDRRTGAVAALLLMADPLYRLHARRAMSDVPVEAFTLATAAIALWGWRTALGGRRPALWIAAAPVAGALAGLAVLSKLSGGLAVIIIASWAALAMPLARFTLARALMYAAGAALAGAVAFATFLTLNPFLIAQPRGVRETGLARRSVWERAGYLITFRARVSESAKERFPDDALDSLSEKIAAVAVQGFGRFGPLGPSHSDSTRRYDWGQDLGAALWGPAVLAGALWALIRGRTQLRAGRPPTAWAVLVQALVALVTVTAFLPLAWDRYFLPIQAGGALLAAGVLVAVFDHLAGRTAPES